MLFLTVQDMERHVDIMVPNYQPRDLNDMKPEVVETYERRVRYHNMICDLLENHMTEVADQIKPITSNDDGEEEKKYQQYEEEKKEDKTLYELSTVYRTFEKRLI